MEKSEQQKEILELGKLLVKELGLQESVDTLSRWMAHYVAEKIRHAEALPYGVKKKNAEKECFSLILDLWKHRWHYKPDRQPFRDFNQLFDTLEKLNPENQQPYYSLLHTIESVQKEDGSFDPSELKNLSPLALQIDKVARIWINYLLHDAAKRAKKDTLEKIIDNAIKLPDSMDAHIIQIVLADSIENIDKKSINHENMEKKAKDTMLKRRIAELQKFKKVNDYLIGLFQKELNN